jgi:hypothetical protein
VVTRAPGWAATLSAALLSAALPASASLQEQEGLAHDPDSGALLYREQHLLEHDEDGLRRRLVVYRCADGTAFARKQVDYGDSALAPSFDFVDARLGYREGLRRDGQGGELWVRRHADGEERRAPVAGGEALVADAGFDEFIRRRWQPLVAGKPVPLQFAVPSRLDAYDFTVRRRGSGEVAGEPAEFFRLRLGGLLGWLAPHIDVAYGRESRRLLRFEGLSNLRDEQDGEPLLARIDFPAPAAPAAAGQWRALEGEPLSACRVRPG